MKIHLQNLSESFDCWGSPLAETDHDQWTDFAFLLVPPEVFAFFQDWDIHYGFHDIISKRLNNPVVQEWLKEFCCPKKSITVFRGLHFSVEDWGGIEKIKQALGTKEIRQGSVVTIPSTGLNSWTKDPKIAKQFSSEGDTWEMEVVVKATIPPDKVLLDFDLLPPTITSTGPNGESLKIRRDEHEVLVRPGTYSGVITWFRKGQERRKVKPGWKFGDPLESLDGFGLPIEEKIIQMDLPNGLQTKVLVNPTSLQAMNLFSRSKDQILRYYAAPDDTLYMWDAFDLSHGDVMDQLGIPYSSDNYAGAGTITSSLDAQHVAARFKESVQSIGEDIKTQPYRTIAYHGSTKPITDFSLNGKGQFGTGLYLTPEKQWADMHARGGRQGKAGQRLSDQPGHIYAFEVNSKRTWIIDDLDSALHDMVADYEPAEEAFRRVGDVDSRLVTVHLADYAREWNIQVIAILEKNPGVLTPFPQLLVLDNSAIKEV